MSQASKPAKEITRKSIFEREHIPVFPEGSSELHIVVKSRLFFLPESGYRIPIALNETSGKETIWQGYKDGIYDKVDPAFEFLWPSLVPKPVRRIVGGEQISDARPCQMFCTLRHFDDRLLDQGQINNFALQYPEEIHKVGAVLFPTFVGTNKEDICFVGLSSTKGDKIKAQKFKFLEKKIFPAETWKMVLQRF